MENEEKNLTEPTTTEQQEEVKLDEVLEGGEQSEQEESKPTKQSQSQNAKFAQQRREAEAKARAEKEASEALQKAKDESYRKGLRDGIKVNPYSEAPLEDEYDLEVYQIQKELDEAGKDPVKDLPKELAKRKREQAKTEKEQEQAAKEQSERQSKEREEALNRKRKEIAEVKEEYGLSDEEMKNLLTGDGDFAKTVNRLENRWTLKEIFEVHYKGSTSHKRSTPSTRQTGTKVEKSIMDMTDEEFIEWKKNKRA